MKLSFLTEMFALWCKSFYVLLLLR